MTRKIRTVEVTGHRAGAPWKAVSFEQAGATFEVAVPVTQAGTADKTERPFVGGGVVIIRCVVVIRRVVVIIATAILSAVVIIRVLSDLVAATTQQRHQ